MGDLALEGIPHESSGLRDGQDSPVCAEQA